MDTSNEKTDKMPLNRVILMSCGRYNPPTHMHLRMFGESRHDSMRQVSHNFFFFHLKRLIIQRKSSEKTWLCWCVLKMHFVNKARGCTHFRVIFERNCELLMNVYASMQCDHFPIIRMSIAVKNRQLVIVEIKAYLWQIEPKKWVFISWKILHDKFFFL